METSSPPTLSLWSQFWKESEPVGLGLEWLRNPGRSGQPGLTGGPASFFGREAWDGHVRGLRESNPRPVHSAGVSRPRVACGLPQMRRVQPVPGRDVHVLRERREDLLQAGLRQVSPLGPGPARGKVREGREGRPAPGWIQEPLGGAGPAPAGIPGVLGRIWEGSGRSPGKPGRADARAVGPAGCSASSAPSARWASAAATW